MNYRNLGTQFFRCSVTVLAINAQDTSAIDGINLSGLQFRGIFSSPGGSPGRAIVLPLVSALASALAKC